MNENFLEFKRMLIGSGLFVKKNSDWYQGKVCPYCGDTKSHYRIHIGMDDSPISQYCFKCNVKGCINEKMLECYGIDWKGSIPRGKANRSINAVVNSKTYEINTGTYDLGYMRKCIDYIEGRLGVDGIVLDELNKFGVILNPNEYVSTYLGGKVDDVNRIWFLCTNGSIIGRDFLKKKDGWEKYSGSVNTGERMLYTIKSQFDLYKDINVCICEGIMDAIGLYYHGGIDNGVYISVLGRDYMTGVQYMLDRGIFGDSVCIHIYKDADVKDVRIDKSKCMWFKSVDVYMNTIGKDFGVSADEIEIEKCMGE